MHLKENIKQYCRENVRVHMHICNAVVLLQKIASYSSRIICEQRDASGKQGEFCLLLTSMRIDVAKNNVKSCDFVHT